MSIIIQSIIDGLLIGGVYATIAIGLSLGFGVMRIINFAHGEVLMVTMYMSYFIISLTGLDPYLVMIITGVIMFGVGYALQHSVLNRILEREKAREPISVLLFTAGLGMVLSNLALILFGSQNVQAQTAYSGRTIILGDLYISLPKLISFGIAIAVALLLYLFLEKTEMGRAIRATSQNRAVARLMGVKEKFIYCLSFGISTMLVGISGSLLIPYFSVFPTVGVTFGLKSFIIVVLGGMGSVVGALMGGLLIGVIEKIGGQFLSESYTQMLVFILFVVVLLVKPSGLLSKERE